MQMSEGLNVEKPRMYVPLLSDRKEMSSFVPNSSVKFSERDNIVCNKIYYDRACAQERLAERMMDASKQLLDQVNETTSNWQREVNHTIRGRIDEINFAFDEMTKQRKEAALEVEALDTIIKRVEIAVAKIEHAISINYQCFALREKRTGVDLCVDEVERKLLLELKVLKGAQDLFKKAIQEAAEQQRVLQSAIFLIDEDLNNKHTAIKIDKNNLILRDCSLNPNGGSAVNYCTVTTGQWEYNATEVIRNNAMQINNAYTLRLTIDNLLKQAKEDLCNQKDTTNTAFKLRIDETKKLKHTLEERHNKCVANISDLTLIIGEIEQKLSDKQRSLALCQLRLNNRSGRPDPELVCDLGQEALVYEYKVLQTAICKIKQKLDENNALMRYLKQACLQMEEEINNKANASSIDEVECMTYREALVFADF